jgi:hypothetical protein
MQEDPYREETSPISPELFGDVIESTQPTNSEPEKHRDPRRKVIEAKAAGKRKKATSRLSLVLADRTKGLPEPGLANQLSMAADLLE